MKPGNDLGRAGLLVFAAVCELDVAAGWAHEATEIALKVINALDDAHADAAQEYEPVAEPWRSTMGSSSVIGDL